MARTNGAETLNLDLYRHLRADIIFGRFEFGARLHPESIRREFGVSIGVVREALTRLESHGLVRVVPNRGVYIPSFTAEGLLDLVEARVVNETVAVRGAVLRGDHEWEAGLIAAHHRMTRLDADMRELRSPRNIDLVDAHTEFHLHMFRGCGNQVLIDICARLQDAAELYRTWSAAVSRRVKSRSVSGEHKKLLDAVLSKDADRAAELHEAHIRKSASVVLENGSCDSPG